MNVHTSPAAIRALGGAYNWPGVPVAPHIGWDVIVEDGEFSAVLTTRGWFARERIADDFQQITDPDLLDWLRAVSEPRPRIVVGFTPAGFPILATQQ